MMICCVLFPVALLSYASLNQYNRIRRDAEHRIDSTLDVLVEHALKVFQTADLLLNAATVLTENLDDAAIRAREASLHRAFRSMSEAVPEVQSMWVFSAGGVPLATNFIFPLPTMDVTDRDFYRTTRDQPPGTYVGGILLPKIPTGAPFFTVSRRRPSPDQDFTGLLNVSLLPSSFEASFARIADDEANMRFRMVRTDGVILASYPGTADPRVGSATYQPAWLRETKHRGDRGLLVAAGEDGISRLVGYRSVPGFPVYLLVSTEESTIWREWLADFGSHLAFGLPVTVVILSALGFALQRTRMLYVEAERRGTAEAALRRAQRLEAIGKLTGGIAHDFNNLLMVIQGSAERLESVPMDARHRRSLELIDGAVRRGEALTRQLLTFSRDQPLSVEVVDLSAHLRRFQDVLRRSLRGDIETNVEIPSAACPVQIDPGEFELALLNIAVNARDAMPDGGFLTVQVRPVTLTPARNVDGLTGAFIAVSVSDSGTGITPEIQPRVFDPFFTTKEVGHGTGLGLSQVYGFVRQSGGTVTIDSIVGEGTTVTLYIPCTREPLPNVVRHPASETRLPDGHGILLVEDNDQVAEVCAGFLRDLGLRVDRVSDGQSALDELQGHHHYDIVLSDVIMPGAIGGIDLARKIRQLQPDLPVLLITGYTSNEDIARQEGLTILRKPYDQERLREAIEAAIAAKRVPEQAG
jgi:two-component system NtrC family sensor kinase